MKSLRLSSLILLLFPLSLVAQNLSGAEAEAAITQTWYSYKVGDSNIGEMLDTKNHERLTFKEDGTGQIIILHKSMGEIAVDFGWKFNEADYALDLTLDMNGTTQNQSLEISKLTKEALTLVDNNSQKITEYSTKMSEPFAGLAKKVSDNPNNTLNMDAWEGKYVFAEAAVFVGDDKTESYPGAGEIVLHSEGGKKHVSITHNGETETHPVSQGQFNLNGNRHFVFVTDNPDLAGGIMVMNDGSLFSYRDKDNNESRIEYILAE